MKQCDKPKWRQIFQPSSNEELIELKSMLIQYNGFSVALEAFLCAKVQVMNAKARVEINPELRLEYRYAANALTELLGEIFSPSTMPTTKSQSI